MDTSTLLIPLLAHAYGLHQITLHPLSVTPTQQVYRVDHPQRPSSTLRAYAVVTTADEQRVQTLATLLTFLEAHQYPAERILRTRENTTSIRHHEWHYLLTTFIRGQTPPYEPPALRVLGAALGQLHSLAQHIRSAGITVPPAQMCPAPELAYALGQLRSVEPLVPAHRSARYEQIIRAIEQIDPCDDLPQVLIHNDYHPGNCVYTAKGELVVIDWNGAGWGAAVIDVGFLLSSCDTQSPWTPALAPNPERVEALVDGYCQYHSLASAELDRLEDTMRFRALVYGACEFADSIRAQRTEEGEHWWWRRYCAAEEIAERARRRFDHHA